LDFRVVPGFSELSGDFAIRRIWVGPGGDGRGLPYLQLPVDLPTASHLVLSFLGEDFMLGPALKELFLDLNRRKQLTKYETDIHRELLAALLADHLVRTAARAGVAAPDHPADASSTTKVVNVSQKLLRSLVIPGDFGEALGNGPSVEMLVDLSPGGRGRDKRMQTACTCTKCPNKRL
jgi:hypothetical protein